jgi:hypothetical protein
LKRVKNKGIAPITGPMNGHIVKPINIKEIAEIIDPIFKEAR